MKVHSLFLLLFAVSVAIHAQQIAGGDPNGKLRLDPKEKLDVVKAICLYEQTVIHIQEEDGYTKQDQHRMILQAGNNVSRYVDEKSLLFESMHDSMVNANTNATEAMNILIPLKKGYNREENYKNYPEGSITTRMFLKSTYIYEEAIPAIQWTLATGEKEIIGYICKKATCRLFGRDYEVWYSPEIPLSNGPWKFAGLPGLILEAKDQTGKVSFSCIALEFPKAVVDLYIPKSTKSAFKTKKATFRKMEEDYLKNPLGSIKSSAAGSTIKVDPEMERRASRERKKTFIELELE